MALTMSDDAHQRVTRAANLVSEACQELEQAGHHNAACEKLHVMLKRAHTRLFNAWYRNVRERKRGRKS